MKLRVPFYYDQFHCITSECKDNCCVGGWEIDIDDDTYNYYMSLDGELGDRIRESITKSEDGSNCFKLVDGHCGLLDKCGLCTIHKELGAEHLSVVCDQFPRYSEYYGEIKESGIGLACEEAERIIFSENKTFTTVLKPCDEEYSEDDEYDSVSATSMKSAIDALNSFMGAFSLIMGAVASISLLVGGIGIMNIMLVSVTERTREIGIRKSLGAKQKDIRGQFVIEAGTTSAVGGVLGIVFGLLLAKAATIAVGAIMSSSMNGITFSAVPTLSDIAVSFGVSVGIGVLFGYLPANKAAKLNPIDALRYE